MKIERTLNAKRNVAFGIILRIYSMILPFFMRTALIYLLGVEYLGLNSLFASVLQVLNLAELGVGNAMVYSMYKPIAEDDTDNICALLNLYRLYYRIIGLVVLLIGLGIIPILPKLITGHVPNDINIYYLYLLNLIATVLSYWLFAYRISLFNAHQRNDVVSKVNLITLTIQYIVQFLVLLIFHNYYYYVITILLTQALNNILVAYFSKKMFPQYYPKGIIPRSQKREIDQRVRDVFTSKIGGTILNSADTIVISAFLGLRLLAIYQNYYYIISSVMALFTIMYSSLTAGIGNSLLIESREKNFTDFQRLTYLTFALMAISMSELICLYQPFMKFWVGETLMLKMPMVVLFCIYFFCVEYVMLISTYKDAAGIWHEDRFRPLASSIVNLILNLLMVKSFGLYGIIISTILSASMISIPWITINVFKLIFKGYFREYLLKIEYFSFVIILCMSISYFISSWLNYDSIFMLAINGVIILCICCSLIYLMTKRTEEFNWLTRIIIGVMRK